ncbi:MAG TPA: NAD(P)/FAD-dependent oxidoreductase [Solirubrobacteraceae bacterium]|nr:NAD(P)/FAD-dependent oxidoreductase [Solirubrobacteraceae bacterium]
MLDIAPAEPRRAAPPLPAEAEVVIIGAGFSGLGTAIRLAEAGVDDVVLLERASEIGGTWWANTYPGCTCDVPSHLYSFSFAPNPGWSETYARQPEIEAYLQRVAAEFGVRDRVRTDCAVTGAAWEEDAARWRVESSRGEIRARVLVSAAGPFAEPRWPDVPGLDRFGGRVFHSARWDHGYDLGGKRVAVVGTGASAIQVVPEIAPRVARLYVLQRTAPWVLPHRIRRIRAGERRVYRAVPAAQKGMRAVIYAGRELLVLGFAKRPPLMGVLERAARGHIRRQVRDPALRRAVTPDYLIGCKRILPSNRWYPALTRPNVELIPEGLAAVTERGVVTEGGRELEVDAIVCGTGFHVTDMPIAGIVRGRDGRTLAETWNGSPRAHLGTTVPGFPNLFLMLGPNTGVGHSSMVYIIESQAAYVAAAVGAMRAQGVAAVEVRPEVAAASNAWVDARARGTVWNTGCSSWYQDATGRNAALWPDWTFRFRRRLRRFDASEYRLRPAEPGARLVPAGERVA